MMVSRRSLVILPITLVETATLTSRMAVLQANGRQEADAPQNVLQPRA
jgi:hypothetical protein